MPLQNRIDPFGRANAIAARGLFTGNRGVIHDPDTRSLLGRRWTTRAWIICALDHPNGRKRDVMGSNGPNGSAGWTELFFLDEVTALAAGHRPCFYCRRARAKAFLRCFGTDNAPAMDAVLHRQRPASGGIPPPLTSIELARLPDGAMVAADGQAHALRGGKALHWTFAGYDAAVALRAIGEPARLVTPPATIAALRAGYAPVWHPSADA